MSNATLFPSLVLAGLTLLLGCSESSCLVRGHVTLDGKPLSNGSISLHPAAHLAGSRPVSAEIDEGKFTFVESQGITPGVYKVLIVAWRETGDMLNVDEGEPLAEYEQYLPIEYNSHSKLSADIRGRTTDLEFELKSSEPLDPPAKESSQGEAHDSQEAK